MLLHSERAADREAGEATSHWGVAIWTFIAWSDETRLLAVSDCGPDRESNIRCFAPREAIHCAALRPRPPSPPAMRYEASGSKA